MDSRAEIIFCRENLRNRILTLFQCLRRDWRELSFVGVTVIILKRPLNVYYHEVCVDCGERGFKSTEGTDTSDEKHSEGKCK